MPATTFFIEMHGPRDDFGNARFCLHWRTPAPDAHGRNYRAQEYRSNPDETRARMITSGASEAAAIGDVKG